MQTTEPAKLCRGCMTFKSLTDFSLDNNKKDGRQPRCKACYRLHWEEKKEYYKLHKAAYHLKNKARFNAISRDYQHSHRKENALRSKLWAESNPERKKLKSKISWLKTEYGLSLEQYNQMLIDQDDKCKICNITFDNSNCKTRACVDHCHDTGKIRGLLCHSCNRMLGEAGDDINTLKTAVKYLQSNDFADASLKFQMPVIPSSLPGCGTSASSLSNLKINHQLYDYE